MKSVNELRIEARRLIETTKGLDDQRMKREMAARAFELAQRAEAIEKCRQNPELLGKDISRYRSMLTAKDISEDHKRFLEELLTDAEALLAESADVFDQLTWQRTVTAVTRQIYLEIDERRQEILRNLLIQEENKLGQHGWQLEIVEQCITDNKRRIDAQNQRILKRELDGHDVTTSRQLLQNLIWARDSYLLLRSNILANCGHD